MNDQAQVYVAGVGMITPVGGNTKMTMASVGAAISAYAASTYCNDVYDAITMTAVPEGALPCLSQDLSDSGITSRQARMLRLAQPALTQVLHNGLGAIPLFLAGPEPLYDGPLPMRSVFIQHLQVQLSVEFDLEASKVFPMGRAGVFYALESAFKCLQNSEHKYVLLGGVDTYNDPLVMGSLISEERAQTNRGGGDTFVPGEGAGFLLLTKDQAFKNHKRIYRPGVFEETGHRYSDEVCHGDGLTQAFSQAIEFSGLGSIEKIYSSLNGESFSVKEYAIASTRNSSVIHADCQHWHPADCYGDLGAASGAILLALSAESSSDPVLCFAASDDEFRGAACVA